MNAKNILTSLVAAIAVSCAGLASASVSNFAIGGTYTQGGLADLATTTISLGGAGSFLLDPGVSATYFDFTKPGNGTFSTTADVLNGYYFLRSYAGGESISASNFGSQVSGNGDWDTILVGGQARGVWTASHAGYLGFETAAGNFGWIGYDFTRVGTLSTIHFLNGAYETTSGAAIAAGPAAVPEPASLALLGLGLLGLGVSRRKSAK